MFHSAFRSNRDKIEASTNSELQRHRLEFGIFPQEAPKKELPKLGDTLDAIRVSTVIVDCMGLHCSTREYTAFTKPASEAGFRLMAPPQRMKATKAKAKPPKTSTETEAREKWYDEMIKYDCNTQFIYLYR